MAKDTYAGKIDSEVWNKMSPAQRRHFIDDHFDRDEYDAMDWRATDVINKKYGDIPESLKSKFADHVHRGSYEKGGKLSDKQEGMKKLVRFINNYKSDFIEKTWHDDEHLSKHLRQKFNSMKGEGREAIMAWVSSLDTENEKKLFEYVENNYEKGGKAGKGKEETRVFESSVGDKEGWAFSVGKNFTSALYKTKKEAERKLEEYLSTGKHDWYGSAEMAKGGKAGYKKFKEGMKVELTSDVTTEDGGFDKDYPAGSIFTVWSEPSHEEMGVGVILSDGSITHIPTDYLNIVKKSSGGSMAKGGKAGKGKVKTKSITVFSFDELSSEAQEKAIENARSSRYEMGQDYVELAIDDDYLFEAKHDELEKLFGKDFYEKKLNPNTKYHDEPLIKNTRKNIYFDTERNRHLDASNAMEVRNDGYFLTWLGLSDELMDKTDYKITSDGGRDADTIIEFEPSDSDYEFTKEEEAVLENAKDKFSDHMSDVLKNIESSIEYNYSDEAIKQELSDGEDEFMEDGSRAEFAKGGSMAKGGGVNYKKEMQVMSTSHISGRTDAKTVAEKSSHLLKDGEGIIVHSGFWGYRFIKNGNDLVYDQRLLKNEYFSSGGSMAGGGGVGDEIKTISDLRRKNKESGRYFFSPSTMKTFKSRIESEILGGKYFITSEMNFDNTKRQFTIRSFKSDGAVINNPFDRRFDTKAEAKDFLKTQMAHGGAVGSSGICWIMTGYSI